MKAFLIITLLLTTNVIESLPLPEINNNLAYVQPSQKHDDSSEFFNQYQGTTDNSKRSPRRFVIEKKRCHFSNERQGGGRGSGITKRDNTKSPHRVAIEEKRQYSSKFPNPEGNSESGEFTDPEGTLESGEVPDPEKIIPVLKGTSEFLEKTNNSKRSPRRFAIEEKRQYSSEFPDPEGILESGEFTNPEETFPVLKETSEFLGKTNNSKRSPRRFVIEEKRHHSSEFPDPKGHDQSAVTKRDNTKRSPRRYVIEQKRQPSEEVFNQDQGQ
ncbi:hypothetical protein RclHR1_12670006 [Rhizophagus clarus]|uniref:Uncharacterized protein n=1 Tax=Rhizophagus clarus TaxID=94130 RepID=A0A2Z6Q7X4_9GLOM|nr:hypothetical protein RclHR1_12670006 [Rhizophagus clarus]GES89090.1 hypothetical protein GLOIN_2v1472004 [Rhizophagus clarus]